VKAAREVRDQLRERQKDEAEALRRGALLANGSTANPVVQKVQQSLNETEVEIAGLKSQLAERQRAAEQLRALVNVVPEVEAEFARLNRDYNTVYGVYNELVARLDKANMGEEAESTDSIKFEIIDPPSASFTPVKPNRALLMGAVLVLGLGAGGGVAFVMHMLRPVFFSSRSLQEIAGFPVLGVVSMAWLSRYRKHRMFALGTFALAIAGLMVTMILILKFQPALQIAVA
jgi:uncharacterized protein involved in exopolysaccharide biosynthesis